MAFLGVVPCSNSVVLQGGSPQDLAQGCCRLSQCPVNCWRGDWCFFQLKTLVQDLSGDGFNRDQSGQCGGMAVSGRPQGPFLERCWRSLSRWVIWTGSISRGPLVVDFGDRREELAQPGSLLRWVDWLSSVPPGCFRLQQHHTLFHITT